MPAEDVGKIAYCMTARGAVPGVVVEWRGERAKVLVMGGGRETWTDERIFWVSEARAPMHSAKAAVDAMTTFHERVEDAMHAVDLAALWDLLTPDGGSHYPDDLASILFSKTGPEHACAVACALALDKVHFRGVPGGAWAPCAPEAVSQALAKKEREQQDLEMVKRAAVALRTALDETRPPDTSDEDQARGVAWLKALAVDGPKGGDGAFGVRVLEGVEGGSVSSPQAGALDLLIRLGVFHEDEILGMHVNHIRTRFPPEVLEDAAAIAKHVMDDPDVATRRAIAHAAECAGPLTIDDPWTTEVDDALMVERLPSLTRVHVLIADPGAGIDLDCPTAMEGMSRAATLYLPTGKVPML
ncbi:MAG: RNB domain-containing ribonuclease, partial [Deltaproteobacteria bacterium]|nr:RNB domain-containing ribonuclease [Deltaproteobacteria bacterium]